MILTCADPALETLIDAIPEAPAAVVTTSAAVTTTEAPAGTEPAVQEPPATEAPEEALGDVDMVQIFRP